MFMPRIRKERAGNDSFGNSWPKDGAVIDVDAEQVAALMAIPDGGFSEVTPTGDDTPAKPKPEKAPEPEPAEDSNPEFAEVDPQPELDEAPKAPAKKAAARKTTASKE